MRIAKANAAGAYSGQGPAPIASIDGRGRVVALEDVRVAIDVNRIFQPRGDLIDQFGVVANGPQDVSVSLG